jgi:hypothetical protein
MLGAMLAAKDAATSATRTAGDPAREPDPRRAAFEPHVTRAHEVLCGSDEVLWRGDEVLCGSDDVLWRGDEVLCGSDDVL